MQYLRQPKPVNAKLCTLGFMPWAKLAWSLLTKLKQAIRTICVSNFRRLNLFIEFFKGTIEC